MIAVYNFNPGPAILPREALKHAQEELLDYKGTGISIVESSHRSPEYTAVNDEAQANIKQLLNLTGEYSVLFLQGGASLQFAMVPMNFLGKGQTADYTNSGSWASKAIKEAQKVGAVNIAADTNDARPARVPTPGELALTDNAAYLHITTNETISGAQWHDFPDTAAPLVADMSSDILSRPIDIGKFALIYAGAQKNLGPSGVTVVIAKNEFIEKGDQNLPAILQFRTQAETDSLYNTPPTFAVYLVMLCTRWLLDQGGVDAIAKVNEAKAGKIYAAIDATDFYTGTAEKEHRSRMNVTFNLPSEDLEAQFVKEADAQGLKGLKGHRSVGGVRASIYNAFPEAGVDALVRFMQDFEKKNG